MSHFVSDYLPTFTDQLQPQPILTLRQAYQIQLQSAAVAPFRVAVESVQDLQASWFDFSGDIVEVGRLEDLTPKQQQTWQQVLQVFCPWKKGPFRLFGTLIDAEWRSDWKWARLRPHIQPLQGRRVADIGCHNGYFMFRMAHEQPLWVIGFEPVPRHFWNFQLLQNLVRQHNLTFELLGVEQMDLYAGFFDTIFCLGILYHHPDPIALLGKLKQALAPQGEIVIDCQGIPGDDPIALTPRQRYAQARGIWFLPTQSCLEHWLIRVGFRQVRCIYAAPLTVTEQRRTAWANIDSLAEFLDPHDRQRTIEGYAAPWRYYFIAQR